MTVLVTAIAVITVKEKRFENTFENNENIKIRAIVKSYAEEKTYGNEVIVEANNRKYILDIPKSVSMQYGDIVEIEGKYQSIISYKNSGVFNYKESLKKENIYGKIKLTKYKKVGKKKSIYNYFVDIKHEIKEKIANSFNRQTSSIMVALLLGDKGDIDNKIKEYIQENGLSHLLAISGMHISCLILIFQKLLDFISEDNRQKKIAIILILTIFGLIIGFVASAMRAIIMAILAITAKLFYRKNNYLIDISIASLLILFYNPYYLVDSGFQLSFVATIGIIYFFPRLNKFKFKNKFVKYFFEIFLVTISVVITIFPLTIYFLQLILNKKNEKPTINLELINHQDFTNTFINGKASGGNESQYNSIFNKNNQINIYNSSPSSLKSIGNNILN